MRDFPIETDEKYDCLQSLLVSFAKANKMNYEMLFSGTWGLSYDNKNKLSTIGSRINPYGSLSGYQKIKHFHGIDMETVFFNEKKEKVSLRQIGNSIVNPAMGASLILAAVDTYHCPWDVLYQKDHMRHYILITDKVEGEYVFCKDQHSNKGKYRIDTELPVEEIRILKKGKRDIICEDEYYDDLKSNYEKLKSSEFIKNLKAMMKDIGDLESFENECRGKNSFYSIPLFVNLKLLATQRKCFIEYLLFLKQYINTEDLRKLLFTISNRYTNLRLLLTKEMISSKIQKVRRREIIDDIIDYEGEALDGFQDIIRN